MQPQNNSIFVISAPSGAGKTSLVNALVGAVSHLNYSVSHTTRPKRPGEVEGEHYHFVSLEQYQALRDQGAFIEHAEVFGQHYATSRQELAQRLQAGDIILDIDWQGAEQVRKYFPEHSCTIFILPPSVKALEERLQGRQQDDWSVIQKTNGAVAC